MDGKTRPRSLIVTVFALVLAIGAIGIGVASAQVTGDTFTGCLKGGTLTKVAIGSEPVSPCSQSSTEVSWNEEGTPGVLGFYTRSVDIKASLSANQETRGTAMCDEGDVATGGGFDVFTNNVGSDAQATVLDNKPVGEDGWFGRIANFTGDSLNVNPANVYVRCADVTP